jgi:hypothetical protein
MVAGLSRFTMKLVLIRIVALSQVSVPYFLTAASLLHFALALNSREFMQEGRAVLEMHLIQHI